MIPRTYLTPTQEQGRALFTRGISGSVVMLNLLRFRSIADYSLSPSIAPAIPIRQLLVVEPHQGQQRRVQVVDMHLVLAGVIAILIGRPIMEAALDPGPGQHPGGAVGQGQRDRFGQELDPDVAAGGAERAAPR